MCSNEVLKERISNMKEQNQKEHKELFKSFEKLSNKFDIVVSKLDNTYVMRREFKVAIGLLWVFATIIWIIWFFIK